MSDVVATAPFITTQQDGSKELNLLVEGMHCPSCVVMIESALRKQPDIIAARLNLTTRRLRVAWRGDSDVGDRWVSLIQSMGYRAVPFDTSTQETAEQKEEKRLLRCLAVAGFASGNLMLFSIPLWTSDGIEMGEATRTMFQWVQALIAMPAIAYAGIPFYRSAWRAVREFHANMDVPISVAVILATLMSVFETITRGQHAYFDSGVMLLFFLLIGRYLEARARGRARNAAQQLLQMMVGTATHILPDGSHQAIALADIGEGMRLLVATGEKIGADGRVLTGVSDVDTSLITGESLPKEVRPGDLVFAGTINQSAPLVIEVTKASEKSLIADIVRLMEVAEQGQARYVTLADRISSWYTPAVHALAAATFVGWVVWGGVTWQVALLYAATVLIITCPCALGLAVPVVQVLASGFLMRRGVLLKSASALERLSGITHAVFDKTGTLTLGKPALVSPHAYDESALQWAASLAAHSKHPLSQAIVQAYHGDLLSLSVREVPACGLEATYEGTRVRLGKRSWCYPDAPQADDALPELWLVGEGTPPIRFTFNDALRPDAEAVVTRLKAKGIQTHLLSGDRPEVVKAVAQTLKIGDAKASLTPIEKSEFLATLKQQGMSVLMVGDGLNDAPSLAAATVSMSPTSAIDITQNAADMVFQGESLKPVLTAWNVARFAQVLVRQNFLLSIGYNIIAIPVAVAGYVTPLVAAVAMSSSSLLVIANAMRLNWQKGKTQ